MNISPTVKFVKIGFRVYVRSGMINGKASFVVCAMLVPYQQVSFEEGFAAFIYKYHSIHDA